MPASAGAAGPAVTPGPATGLQPGAPPERVAPGCWRIVLPDPYPPGAVAVWLLETPRGHLLLDAGPPGEEAGAALAAGLEELGLAPDELAGVLLSHHHLDHVGGLAVRRPGPIVAHAATARRLARGGGERPDRAEALLRRAGVPGEARTRLGRYREPGAPDALAGLRVDRRLEGEEGGLEEAPGWRWHRVRGHAPGHLLLHRPDDGVMLAFDQFMERLKTPLALDDADADPWGDYLRSLRLAADLEPAVLLPAHTGGLRPAVPWLARRRRAMERSLERIAGAVEAGSETAWAAAERIYSGDPGPAREALLVRETLAGLRRLAAVGTARRRIADGVERYRPV